jgi:hypothetical protein
MGRPAWIMRLSHFGIPASRVTTVAISSMRAPRPSAMRVQYLARSSGVVCDQDSKAARAAVAAASTSSAVPAATWAMTSPLVESWTSIVSEPVDGTQPPSM